MAALREPMVTELHQLRSVLYVDAEAECTSELREHALALRAALHPESGDDVPRSEVMFSASMLASGCPALRLMPLLTPLWRRLGRDAWEEFSRKWTTAIFHELTLQSDNESELQHNLVEIKIGNSQIWNGPPLRPGAEDPHSLLEMVNVLGLLAIGDDPEWLTGVGAEYLAAGLKQGRAPLLEVAYGIYSRAFLLSADKHAYLFDGPLQYTFVAQFAIAAWTTGRDDVACFLASYCVSAGRHQGEVGGFALRWNVGHSLLGLLALRNGDVAEATARLEMSFSKDVIQSDEWFMAEGPMPGLMRALVVTGRVEETIRSVEAAWRVSGPAAIASWVQALRSGESPDWELGFCHQVE